MNREYFDRQSGSKIKAPESSPCLPSVGGYWERTLRGNTINYTIAGGFWMDYQELTKKVISEKRLQRYGSLNPSDLPETMSRYLWNIGLCEALYPLLNGLEVALRNRIHAVLTTKTGKTRWMDPKWNLLKSKDLNQVNTIINRLRREHKSQGVDRIISALTLGFWVNLFSVTYEQEFWTGHSLRGVFQDAPKVELGCHKIRKKLYRIKYLRNRVFHHEPIFHWAGLDSTYEDIVSLNKWLNRDWASLISLHDRFRLVHRGGIQPYLDKLIIK